MFYTTDTDRHGLRHNPFKAIVSPRPIGWIGTRGLDGSINLSPYSFFNAVQDEPPIVMFASGGFKHSARNARDTGVFTASMATKDLAEKINASSISVAYGVSEFEIAGLTPVNGRLVDAPYVGEAHAALECRVTEIIEPRDLDGQGVDAFMVLGQVVGVHISDMAIKDGMLDMAQATPLARLGYMDYAAADNIFQMRRPKAP